MKRRWEAHQLDEHFTLRDTERDLLANKTGATRLGFAVSLTYFQMEARFPLHKHNVPKLVIAHLAKQLELSPELYLHFDWQGLTIKFYRVQTRDFFGFREATAQDAQELLTWLCHQILPHEHAFDHLNVALFQELRVRMLHEASRTFSCHFAT